MPSGHAVITPAGGARRGVISLPAMTTRSIDTILRLDATQRLSLHWR